MSEEQKQSETTTVVNNELTGRLNKAFDAKNFSLFSGSDGNIIMIQGSRGDVFADIVVRYEDLEDAMNKLKSDVVKTQEPTDTKSNVEAKEENEQ